MLSGPERNGYDTERKLSLHFFETGSHYGKSWKCSPSFPYRWRHCPTPWPLASDLWTLQCLITTTTTVADYCLCSCFLQLTCIVFECESQQQFDLIIASHKQFWFPCTSHFHLPLLCSVSPSTVCLHTARKLNAHAPPLLLCFWWISSTTYRPGIWTTATVWDPFGRKYSRNDAKERGKDRGKKRLLSYMWTRPQKTWHASWVSYLLCNNLDHSIQYRRLLFF